MTNSYFKLLISAQSSPNLQISRSISTATCTKFGATPIDCHNSWHLTTYMWMFLSPPLIHAYSCHRETCLWGTNYTVDRGRHCFCRMPYVPFAAADACLPLSRTSSPWRGWGHRGWCCHRRTPSPCPLPLDLAIPRTATADACLSLPGRGSRGRRLGWMEGEARLARRGSKNARERWTRLSAGSIGLLMWPKIFVGGSLYLLFVKIDFHMQWIRRTTSKNKHIFTSGPL